MCAQKVKVGFEGYFVKPDREELLERLSTAVKLNKDQRTILCDAFNSLFEGEKEEDWNWI